MLAAEGRSRGVSVAAADAGPRPVLRTIDAVGLIVGTVIGVGIFKTPSLVAANATSTTVVLLAWVAGGLVSLIGALCYAELASTYPHAGGDYHYQTRAFGRPVGFLFAWARMSVIQTGSIALLAYVFGDYASAVLPLGPFSSAIWAAAAVLVLTAINVAGVRGSALTQNALTAVEVAGVVLVILAALAAAGPSTGVSTGGAAAASSSSLGLIMVFVLLTYGGWNEAAYLSAEVRDPGRTIVRAFVWSLAIITGLYLLANWAYLQALGMAGVAQSQALAADVLRLAFGERASALVSVMVGVAALTSANAAIFTGARTSYALGRDYPAFALLGRWHGGTSTPAWALAVQAAVCLALIALGAATRRGFETMVEYTAPVFWLFFLLSGVSLFVLRRKEPGVARPFRVPLYPLTPILFCATCAYLLYSSLAYTGVGALVGVGVLALGMVLLVPVTRTDRAAARPIAGGR